MKARQTAFLIALLGLALSSTASAGIAADGSVAFTEFVGSYAGATLSAATSITIASSTGFVSMASGTPFSCPGTGCTPASGAIVTTPTTFSVPLSAYASFIAWGDGTGGANNTRYSFTVTNSTKTSSGANDLTISAAGIFADTLGVYDSASASLLLSFTQSGGLGQSVSGSGTFSTHSALTLTPEPDTFAMLSVTLVAFGLMLRKKA
jgi:hypothetical protein